MANPQILRNAKVEMQNSLATAITITGITNANPAVITATNTLTDGDLVVIKGVVGMPKINDRTVRVVNASGTDFEAESLDSSNFGAYVSGGTAEEVDGFVLFDSITNLSFSDDPPQEQDATTIHDSEEVTVFGLDSASTGSFTTIADPLSTTSLEISKAREANERRAFRVTLQSGYVGIVNAFVAGGRGIDGSAGAIATGNVSLTMRNPVQWFVS